MEYFLPYKTEDVVVISDRGLSTGAFETPGKPRKEREPCHPAGADHSCSLLCMPRKLRV